MFFDAVRGILTRALKRKRESEAYVGEAIPVFLDDIVFTYVIKSENFVEPADLA